MKIAILKERRAHETRVAGSPDSVAKLIALGATVVVETGAGDSAHFHDADYTAAGAGIAKSAAAAVKDADVILKIRRPLHPEEGTAAVAPGQAVPDEIALFAKGQNLICHCEALSQPAAVTRLAARGINLFALELLPRITRAQSMDILSSQANMAGYKAVPDALEHYGRAVPMMSTAAGRVPPATVLVMGVGVAGLQAIATAKRLGAVVWATDVRPATKQQVESLGGKFLAVENEEFLAAQTDDGYAKPMSAEYNRQQAALIAERIPEMDIVITTALIPGRPAPVLVSEEHLKSMTPGAVLVDLAVEQGGNCPASEYGKVVHKHGVTLVGHANVPGRLAETTSRLFAQNLVNFVTPMVNKEGGTLTIDREDDIITGTLVCSDGEILHERVRDVIGSSGKKAPAKKPLGKKFLTKKAAAKKAVAKKATGKKAADTKAPDTKATNTPPAAKTPSDDSAKES